MNTIPHLGPHLWTLEPSQGSEAKCLAALAGESAMGGGGGWDCTPCFHKTESVD